ncbi:MULTISPECIES: hydroxymethylglutaryl-CoA reductase (NADPH) [unclassified Methanoregula]|uniref:hydroxymethylglutaryl-CoA reductase (NADPH) n=1 Tax=unclassified Methanoregula TaxID=2649730 RepID=UPI0009D1735E|nr:MULTISPECIES: hydroxymethylglutaryl-CoA reductase (NADPH) [unclassified Methanoregula]OPX61802.1 MAG: 3-hydroxy-3-methylglutaryl-coenzyme A reductase [Methanoregula sp. PtaB.Bin085]OPY33888.1 MAG: 3-hydroxy-3-methylglutaryl-coenzyme A reductase [Methanoregula sp. PtaU1.Bin006]
MADDSGHQRGRGSGAKAGQNNERDTIIRNKLRDGSLRLYELDRELAPIDAIRVRREYIEELTGAKLENIGIFSIDVERVTKRNCENMIGTVQVPVGVAGPIRIKGGHAQGDFWLPLATTEGALVASVNRGCSAITKAGGADVRLLRDGMTRAPVFATDSVAHAVQVCDWVTAHRDELRAAAESTTSHGKLSDIVTFVAGTSVFVRLEFDTKDAMGMNMVTIASAKVGDLIAQGTGARLVALSGNMCADKKPAAINAIMGRGRSVVAGIALTHDQISSILKTDAKTLFEVNYRKNLVGSARAGAMGFNAHAANVVAAMFIACGQDAAHSIDGSTCITTVDQTETGAYVAVTLPSLPVGTVGGGTGVDTQQECLKLLGVAGSGNPPGTNAKKLAEIIGAAVLAGELSLLGALAAQHLARAHQQLGRG